jgi:type I restriction enzyme R subunit
MDEDPVFYEKFSELIDETLAAYAEKRIEQLELLTRMQDIRDRVRDRRSYEVVPDRLKDRGVAKSYFDIVQDQFGRGGNAIDPEIAAEAAVAIDDAILAKRKVDWTHDMDVQNQMKIAIEDELFRLKDSHGLELAFDDIDRILDRCIDVAKRRMP